ncbi:MAG: 2-phospho-L-lactate transferase [archaeon]|nr:2-phospho-L-lactate transferase [archaeon]
MKFPEILIISGGTGGAKLVEGFYHTISPEDIAIIANTGDDIVRFGLRICPDIDILLYTLADIINRDNLWGIKNDSFECLESLSKFYGEDSNWFNLGDKDLATHIFRTNLLNQGHSLSEVVNKIGEYLNIKCEIIPMVENYIPTYVETQMGKLHFQEYYVKFQTLPKVTGVIYGENSDIIIPKRAIELINNVKKIIISNSDPIFSLGPILSIPQYSEALNKNKNKIIAINPLIRGKAIHGPLIKVLESLEIDPTPLGIARYYKNYISKFVFDERDLSDYKFTELINQFRELDIEPYPFDTLMNSIDKKKNLAEFLLNL